MQQVAQNMIADEGCEINIASVSSSSKKGPNQFAPNSYHQQTYFHSSDVARSPIFSRPRPLFQNRF